MASRLLLAAIPLALLLALLACGEEQQASPQVFSTQNIVIALDDEHQGRAEALFTLIDLSTGETMAQLTAGYQTWALLRHSTNELLVSDLEGPDFQGRLLVYDIADVGSPSWILPMQDRVAFTGYTPAMALSEDGRYLYYHTKSPINLVNPNSVGIIDLDAGQEIVRGELPLGCRVHVTLIAIGRSNAEGFCPPNRFVTVDPKGTVSELMPFQLPHQAFQPSEEILRFDPLGVILMGCAGWGGTVPCRLDDGRRLLAYSRDGHALNALVAYDEEHSTDFQHFDLPAGIIHFAPIDADTVALLEGVSAKIYLFDLGTGQVTKELPAPAGTKWLIGP